MDFNLLQQRIRFDSKAPPIAPPMHPKKVHETFAMYDTLNSLCSKLNLSQNKLEENLQKVSVAIMMEEYTQNDIKDQV